MLRPFGFELRKTCLTDPFWVQSQLVKKADPVIFDVGAAVGEVSDKYRKLFPDCTIHAFEPFPASYSSLNRRFTGATYVHLNQVAVGETVGSASLTSNSSPWTNSVLPTDPAAVDSWGGGVLETKSTLPVQMTTIDEYCREHSIQFIDILKLDIQGGELKALQGAKAVLDAGRVGLVFMEIIHARTYVGQPLFKDYLEFFHEVGYAMLDLYSTSWKGVRLLQSDAIFVRADATLQ